MINDISSIISSSNYNCKEFGNKPKGLSENIKNFNPDILSKVKDTKYYNEIIALLNIIETTGTLYRSNGHCIGISDLLSKLLKERGIDSKLVECNLSVIHRDGSQKGGAAFVGHKSGEGLDHATDVPTHVVCVTKTEVPFLIDLSISHISPKIKYVFFPLDERRVSHEKNILTIDYGHSLWTYNYRKENTLVDLHEKSIIDRINTDIKIENRLRTVNKFLYVIITIVSLNSVRGFYDFYQKYIIKDNGFGPNKVEILK